MCCFKVMERRWGLTLSFLEKRIDSPTCSRLSGQTASHLLRRMIFFLPLQLCYYAANFLSVFFPSMMRQILILALIRKASVCLFSYFFWFSLRPRRNVCLLDCGTHRSERLCFMWSCRPLRKRSIVFVRRVSATPSEENKGPPNFKRGVLAPLLSSARPRVQQRCNSFNIGQESLITITVVARLQINEETSSFCGWCHLTDGNLNFWPCWDFAMLWRHNSVTSQRAHWSAGPTPLDWLSDVEEIQVFHLPLFCLFILFCVFIRAGHEKSLIRKITMPLV